tara:strand:- start:509 stop:1402 length:894 start_codon:yes stop_codon:yes gene_type:complete
MPDYSKTKIQLRRGTSAEWNASSVAGTILGKGEPGYDTSSGVLKVGNGTGVWNSLSAITGGGGGGGGGISNVVEDTTPQLGGNLDMNSKDLTGNGDFLITGSGVITETMDNHCGFIIQSNGDTNGELHFGSCADSAGVGSAMGLRHSSMTGANDYMIMSNTDGATFVSAKDTKTLTLSGGGNNSSTRLELRDAALGFRFNVNKANVDLQYNGDTDANCFYIDASADSVGIGTATPATKLDVNGTMNATTITQNSKSVPNSDGTGITNASGVTNIVQMTQAAYDALGSYDATTLYYIV